MNDENIIDNLFESALQVELDKLPYEKHVDDGQYNNGQVVGFEVGARWAKEFILKLPIGGVPPTYCQYLVRQFFVGVHKF